MHMLVMLMSVVSVIALVGTRVTTNVFTEWVRQTEWLDGPRKDRYFSFFSKMLKCEYPQFMASGSISGSFSMNTAGCTTGCVNYANEPSRAVLERSSQDAYHVIRLTRSKAAAWTVDAVARLIEI